ncbi:MAG TPA: hypothetical protein VIP77_15325 [Jiangellaceae bacterium]
MSDGTFRGRWIDEVFRTPSISDAVRVSLLALAMDMNAAGDVSVPRRDLAARLSRSERRVNERLSLAIEAGLIERTGRGSRSRTATFQAVLPGVDSRTPGCPPIDRLGDGLQHPNSAGLGDGLQHPNSEKQDTRVSGYEGDSRTPGGPATYKARTDLSDHGDGAIVVRLFDEEDNSTPSLRSQTRASARRSGEHPAFAAWYAEYPKKKARGAAVKAFAAAVKKVDDPQILIDGVIRYRTTDEHVARGYIKNPATWLNQECWLDEPSTAGAPAADPRQQATNDRYERAMQRAIAREESS